MVIICTAPSTIIVCAFCSEINIKLFNFIKLLHTININTTKKVITMVLVKLVYFPSYRI